MSDIRVWIGGVAVWNISDSTSATRLDWWGLSRSL